jgi:hypothetical protein
MYPKSASVEWKKRMVADCWMTVYVPHIRQLDAVYNRFQDPSNHDGEGPSSGHTVTWRCVRTFFYTVDIHRVQCKKVEF